MAIWKVSAERVEMHPHFKADTLEIAKAGMFQLVVGKANGYKTGDLIVFAPKRSVLPLDLRGSYCNAETGKSYLVGDDHDRVSSIRLREELSEGVTIPIEYVLGKLGLTSVDELVVGKDISTDLDISMYEFPIPKEYEGRLTRLQSVGYVEHDVEQMGIYEREFVPGEPIVLTEKIHGSQCAILIEADGTPHVTSKDFFRRNLELIEDATSLYWASVRNTRLVDILLAAFPNKMVQAFAESFPATSGYSYGATRDKPLLRVYRLVVDGVEVSIADAKSVQRLADLWVPVLYEGPFDLTHLRTLVKGKEQVSGKTLHRREGGVVSPVIPRSASEGFALYVKLIASDFRESDDSSS